MAKIMDIEGIGPKYAEQLVETGIKTTDSLLDRCATPSGRKETSKSTGITEKMILRWVNMSDLFRIKGVGEEYSDLLEAAGVDTVPELAQRNAENLAAKMAEVNDEKKLVRQVPSAKTVSGWTEQAKTLPKMVKY